MPYKILNTEDSIWSIDNSADGVIHRDPPSTGLYVDEEGYVAQAVKSDPYQSYAVNKTAATQRMASNQVGIEIEQAIADYATMQSGLDTIAGIILRSIDEQVEEITPDLTSMLVSQLEDRVDEKLNASAGGG